MRLLLNFNADTKIKNFFGTSAHDAMYEIEDILPQIKTLILSRASKRKQTEDTRGMAKFNKAEDKLIQQKGTLRTYSRLEQVGNMIKKIKVCKKLVKLQF